MLREMAAERMQGEAESGWRERALAFEEEATQQRLTAEVYAGAVSAIGQQALAELQERDAR